MSNDQAYLDIEAKIKKAQLSSATELYLGYYGIRELPDSIGSLVHLHRLDLTSNHLTALPESI
jgi:Leucine-rich repeat (LRR) protein